MTLFFSKFTCLIKHYFLKWSCVTDRFFIEKLSVCVIYQIEQLKQELNKKESEMQALQTKLDTLTNQNSDCKQHIEVLKESLSAKDQRANTLQTEVRKCTLIRTVAR